MPNDGNSQTSIPTAGPGGIATRPWGARTVLVAGGAHRVGGAISRHLGALGARVVVTYHSSSKKAAGLVSTLPAGSLALAADLTRPSAAEELFSACAEAGVLPDAVVHSAASFLHKPVADTTAQDWDRVFALNTRAFFLLAQEFARRHGIDAERTAGAGRGPSGGGGGEVGEAEENRKPDLSLVVISDSGALELWPGYAVHSVSKAALEPLVKVLAKALSPQVRVNAVLPGPVLPPEAADQAERDAMAARTLLQRVGDPTAIAHAVAFALENPFLTGAAIPVTGGSHLWRGRPDAR